ncbi:MAG: methyltransferase [Cellvibrionaceae bacterium]|nr:methyltransferase [Cellvibrionaceae bacterium]
MKKTAVLLSLLVWSASGFTNTEALQKAINGGHRTPAYVERDQYRNPLQTLKLFDVQPNHTVVEIWPGGGWYTEILAPYLKKSGKLIAAHYDIDDTQASYRPGAREKFDKKMKADAKRYGKVVVQSLMIDEKNKKVLKSPAPQNSVDRVVTFRSAHGWYARGLTDTVMNEFYSMLKPGGKLGLVQHQAEFNQDWASKNIGYVGRQAIIDAALKAGFKLDAEGYFNNNPKDTRRHENGVWQLPPNLRGLETEQEKAEHKAIGESHRMTLVFVKPNK